MSLRVVQLTTGNVDRKAALGILRHPELELVGCYAWSDEKAGRDVGELVGIDPIGIEATRDLAISDNAKVVVIGGSDGLPLILNPGP